MSLWKLIAASLRKDWAIHVSVACGVAIGTAVLVGALLVGDSMRYSLRQLTIERLGRIDAALTPGRFFRSQLAEELAQDADFRQHFQQAVPIIMLNASAETLGAETPARANDLQLIGCDKRFWQAGEGGPSSAPSGREVVLNRSVADLLGINSGDRIVLRLPVIRTIPSESGLGRRSEAIQSLPLTVREIIDDQGLGRFGLIPSQRSPRNAFVDYQWLAERLDRPEQANTILILGEDADAVPGPEAEAALGDALQPKPADYGLQITESSRGFFQVSSDELILDRATETAIREAFPRSHIQPVLVYLANTIACGDREVPYSIVAAMALSPEPPLGPFLSPNGQPVSTPGENEIVLNSWTAEQLAAGAGDTVRLAWFEPETADGRYVEDHVELRVAGIVALEGAAADPTLTPEVPDITDKEAIADWDPPFPFRAERIREVDEQYWEDHRATPKAFVSPELGRRLWSSRFGRVTSLRIVPHQPMEMAAFRRQLRLPPKQMGFVFQPVKRQGLEASTGTTSFSGLFLGFNMFVMAAGLILVGLLFRLGVERRSRQLGLVAAVGWPSTRSGQWLAAEGTLVAASGAIAGTVLGLGYAALMVWGLRTVWKAAIVTPFVRFHATPTSLVIGLAAGVIVALLVILWGIRSAVRMPPQRLLSGRMESQPLSRRRAGMWKGAAYVLLAAAIVAGFAAALAGEEAQAGAFFGTGLLVLAAVVVWFRAHLAEGSRRSGRPLARLSILAWRNIARRTGRSVATVSLMASACFLIVAISAFHLDPRQQTKLNGGTGGFELLGETAQPLYHDLNVPDNRRELGFTADESQQLAAADFYAVRVRSGQQASCLNLYRPQEPRVLGVPETMIRRDGFSFTATDAQTPAERDNPWLLLDREITTDDEGIRHVPMILDDAAAKYSFHLWQGVGEHLDIQDRNGNTIRLEVVGLLANSIFQGDVLIAESHFRELFPEVGGYRMLLVDTEPEQAGAIRRIGERVLGDFGLAFEDTARRLAEFFAVQNTYLSTFQMIGGLGLLLGTFGLIAVQLRNVLERRNELAMMRAVGFPPRRLAVMVLLENTWLLAAGLAGGLVAAVVAVAPHLAGGRAQLPFQAVAPTLLGVLVVGLAAGWVAVRAVAAIPLQPALRNE